MLKALQIRDYALIDVLELELRQGLTVFTGETGAGKSILLGALGLALGSRADSGNIRPGSAKTEINACIAPLPERCRQILHGELELEPGEALILRRVISAEAGRSRSYINGSPMPLQWLRRIGDSLVEIQGQHTQQGLRSGEQQRELLDSHGNYAKLQAELQHCWQQLTALQRELQALGHTDSASEQRCALLRYQVEELRAMCCQPGEVAQLEEEFARLTHARRLLEICARVQQALDGEDGAASLLHRLVQELQEAQRLDATVGNSRELLQEAALQAEETATALRRYAETLPLDPERLPRVEQRLDALHDLARKHQVRTEQLPNRLESLEQELDRLQQSGVRHTELEHKLQREREQYHQLADQLSSKRALCARRLGEEISTWLQRLGMPGARLEVRLTRINDGPPRREGMDQVEFLVSINPGMPPCLLSKTASGGELSRICLAAHSCGGKRKNLGTLIFDEVDNGVSGGIAELVGQLLRELAQRHQVLCVTHLPQVASQAHQHLHVSKEPANGHSRIRVRELDPEQRVHEIARMLGGLRITRKSLEHAREMLGTQCSPKRSPKRSLAG